VAQEHDPVAVVLAGGGARGAYEMGALSALLPALEPEERPEIVIGTSIGAINAAYLAANADKPPEQQSADGLALWRGIRYEQMLKPLASVSEARRLVEYFGQVLGTSSRASSVLDPAPLRPTLSRLIEFERIRANVEAGHLSAAAVVTTSGTTSLSVVFHDGGPKPDRDARRGIQYEQTQLTVDHVLASAAIPLLFPAVPIDEDAARRWYFDGGTRLNTPIKPALALGARRLIVIALNSLAVRREVHPVPRPDALDGATQLIQALLIDPLVNDVHSLATINELLEDDTEEKTRGHESRTGRQRIPYILIAPSDPDEIGQVATEVYREHYGSPLGLARSPNIAALGHLVDAASGPSHGELLSYLFIAEEFTERLIEMGRRDAEQWLDQDHDQGRWQLGPLR
jgi:NTE family protein